MPVFSASFTRKPMWLPIGFSLRHRYGSLTQSGRTDTFPSAKLRRQTMSDAFAGTIATLQQHLKEQEDEVRATKRLINQLCKRDRAPILYPEADSDAGSLSVLRRDQFYGVPLATAIRTYLEMRRAQGPATV